MSIEGIWDLTISTPIGKIKAEVELRRDGDLLSGTAQGVGEQVPLRELALDGNELTWKQAVTKPMRLNLAFAVTIAGESLSGTAKAGRLPASKVIGQRRVLPA
ncbi:hypothetical protein [Nocardia sp. NPDC056100]|uniref:hypothetical protein n=1 Tax=Nocardia sp. NPDC056100 TaxID=3345712 RepID=UPI0035DEEEEE